MLCVLSDDEVCIRLLAGILTRPAVAGMPTLRLHSTILERVPAVKYDLAGIVPQRYRVVPKR